MAWRQHGPGGYTLLGSGQIDAYGNINSSMFGPDYSHPKVRFPGSGEPTTSPPSAGAPSS